MEQSISQGLPKVARIIQKNVPRIWYILVLFTLVAGLLSPRFLQVGHLLNLSRQAAPLGIVSIGQTAVILTAGLDLSVGAVITLVDVLANRLMHGADSLLLPVAIICLLVGALVGLVNGLLVTKLKVFPLIATLGTMLILKGITFVYTRGVAMGGDAAPVLRTIGAGRIAGTIPNATLIWILLTILAVILLKNTAFGRRVYATGSNQRAAELCGVRTDSTITLVYMLSGISSAAAGLLLAGYLETFSLSVGDQYLMDSITAVVVGGTSFLGGRGGLGGSAGGCIFLIMLFSILTMLNIAYPGKLLIQGFVIAASVALYSAKQ